MLLLSAACSSSEIAGELRMRDAQAAFLLGNYERAAAIHQDILRERPGDAAVLLAVAKCRLGLEEWRDAVALLGEALDADPEDAIAVEIRYRRALAHNALWRPQKALQDLRVVADAPDDIRGRAVREDEFRYRLGVTLIRTGDWERGRTELEHVNPTGPLGAEARLRQWLSGFSVQIARCRESSTADRIVSDAARQGVHAVVASVDPHVVLVGDYTRFKDAQFQAARLRALGFNGAFVIP